MRDKKLDAQALGGELADAPVDPEAAARTGARAAAAHKMSRRGFFGATAATAGLTAAACAAPTRPAGKAGQPELDAATEPHLASQTVPFDGRHQAGVQTASQVQLSLISFNLRDGIGRQDVRRLMSLWTEDARALCAGRNPVGGLEPEMVQIPANLTITVGFGEPMFAKLGLQDRMPTGLHAIPAFEHDDLDRRWGQTDLVVQICGDDPLTVAYAMRHMIRSSVDYAVTGWLQRGFSHADGSMPDGATPRNLFGQKDGTVNPHGDKEYEEQVWIDAAADGEPAWADGGTIMVARRIAMHMDEWEMLDRPSREVVIGRDLPEGAPLSGGDEFTEPDLEKTDETGLPLIDPNSHMAVARNSPDYLSKEKLLRRPYTYDLEPEPGSGDASNVGLVFLCYQKNPDQQFTPIQRRMDKSDRLNQWITHIGSAVYVLPPGVTAAGFGAASESAEGASPDRFWGERLFAD
ncbi:Dyp-type peroxidase [Corynebacterium atypicum]|uniref:Dyp-type peroxidase n=1 Tax=Corynebacterium atypicum TaxID=191610 RepID=UPI0009FF393A|nr:Dyp-type peroxidase [Corynebacterium atypicum]